MFVSFTKLVVFIESYALDGLVLHLSD
jgi:hypothetical protein